MPRDIGNDLLKCGDHGRWVEAGDVSAGDGIMMAGGYAFVASVATYEASLVVHNLSVVDSHTYAVSASGIVVHNKATPHPGFSHAWIQKDLFRDLQRLVGKADRDKFVAALDKGIVGPIGQSGIKILDPTVRGFTHELKIGGSAQRLLGRVDDNGVLVFSEFARGGLH